MRRCKSDTRVTAASGRNHTPLTVVRAREQGRLDPVWMADHFMFQDEDDPQKEVPIPHALVLLGAIGASTCRIRSRALVVGLPYQP